MVQARRCGGEEMLTHKSIMDARSKCPECDGNGKKYYPSDQYSELNTGWPIVKDNCKTCKGTGNAKVVWTEPINAHKKYKFKKLSMDSISTGFGAKRDMLVAEFVSKTGGGMYIPAPYKTGQVITVICDACGGRGRICMENNLACGICENGHDNTCFDRHLCSECKGKPELKVKVTAISVKDNEFIMEGVEV